MWIVSFSFRRIVPTVALLYKPVLLLAVIYVRIVCALWSPTPHSRVKSFNTRYMG